MDPSAEPSAKARVLSALPPTVVALGFVSLFTDVSGEMMVPLLPAFLASHVASPALVLGLMEGLADATSALLKLWSGRIVDRGRKLKPFVVGGYALASAVRPLMGLARGVLFPIAVRVTDRFGKGIRTSPRDAMIARATDPSTRGRAYGFHNAMDHAGAAVGALLALGLSAWGVPISKIFFLSAIPAALAVIAVVSAPEPPPETTVQKPSAAGSLEALPSRFWAFLVPVTLFGFGNATDTFVLLKLTELKARPMMLPLAWLVIHLVKGLASYPAGAVADRVSRAGVVLTGWTFYALSYGLLAVSHTVPMAFGVIAFYGLYHALSEGTEKALLTELVPASVRGRALGRYHALAGLSSLAAGLLFGAAWTALGSTVAFASAGAIAFLSVLLLAVLLPLARGNERGRGR